MAIELRKWNIIIGNDVKVVGKSIIIKGVENSTLEIEILFSILLNCLLGDAVW